MARIDARPPKKAKLVRDSFTIPKAEYAVIGDLKERALGLGVSVKKSELLRAGLKLLQQLDDATLKAALAAVPALKTGRPASDAETSMSSEADSAASTEASPAPEAAAEPTLVKRRPARPRKTALGEAAAVSKPRRRARQAASASPEAAPVEATERPVRARRAARRTARAEAAASQAAAPANGVSAPESATTPQE